MEDQEKKEAIKKLKKLFRKYKKIVINIDSVSYSGMTRKMTVYIGDYQNINWELKKIGFKLDKNCKIIVGGCGMDMTFWLANRITRHVYGDKLPKWLAGNGGGDCRCIDWKVLN